MEEYSLIPPSCISISTPSVKSRLVEDKKHLAVKGVKLLRTLRSELICKDTYRSAWNLYIFITVKCEFCQFGGICLHSIKLKS